VIRWSTWSSGAVPLLTPDGVVSGSQRTGVPPSSADPGAYRCAGRGPDRRVPAPEVRWLGWTCSVVMLIPTVVMLVAAYLLEARDLFPVCSRTETRGHDCTRVSLEGEDFVAAIDEKSAHGQ
jgi:hypothetical protein